VLDPPDGPVPLAGRLAGGDPSPPMAPCAQHAAARQDWHLAGGRGNYGRRMANRYQYTVVELRERMIGGKMSGDKLEKVLNEHAAQGWQLKAITSVEVKGRVGPGGVEGLLVTFERPVG
jgi:Domain of unknown function (DUF4177)